METDAAIITHAGLEDVCQKELQQVLGIASTKGTGVVYFKAPLEKVCEFCYLSRSAIRVLVVLGRKATPDVMLGAESLAQSIDIKHWLHEKTTFACRSAIPDIGQEVAVTVGGIINDRTRSPVNLNNSDALIVIYHIDGEVMVGIDLGGEELGKRDYRIFLGNDSLRGTIAYGLLAVAGYDGTQNMADIFCRSGVISIEAAMLAHGMSPHRHERIFPFRKLPPLGGIDWDTRFDELDKHAQKESKSIIIAMDEGFGPVAAAKKNAKIAGVNQHLEFSRTDLQFLDAKFGKGGLDMIATMPPQPSARINGKPLEKALEQLFYQAEFILKKKGKVAVLTRSNVELLKTLADKFQFMLVEERSVWQGGLELTIVVFTK
jgi:putative N6-adenine-specific DNA methylase